MNEPDISLAQSLIIKSSGVIVSPHLTRFALAAAAASRKIAVMSSDRMESGGIVVNNGGDFPLYGAPQLAPQNIIWSKLCSTILEECAPVNDKTALHVHIEDKISIMPDAVFAAAGSIIVGGRAVEYNEVVADFRMGTDNRYVSVVVPCGDVSHDVGTSTCDTSPNTEIFAVLIMPIGGLSINALLATPYLVQTAFAVAMTAAPTKIKLRMPHINIEARGDITTIVGHWAQSLHKQFRSVEAIYTQYLRLDIKPQVDGTLNFTDVDVPVVDMRRGIVWVVQKRNDALTHVSISAF
jgi:hypothetical protein